MGAAENEAGADQPLTVDVLADLQAGLLDDEAAARVRKRVRDDPAAQEVLRALNRVRGDVAALGADPSSAPAPPPALTSRISKALTTERFPAAHAARPPVRRARMIAGVAGLCAVVAAIGVGTAALINAPSPVPSTQVTAEHITVSPPMTIPLSQPQILDLLNRAPDYGPLGDPPRRASCISGLGYPASTKVLGARPIDIDARPAELLVLPGDTADNLAVFAVALNCSAVDTGLMASTQVPRA
ncbi:MAG: hypothetical protein JO236_03505 [Mycobacterium sp.]|uniref:hypothetical protein n=1 Tax=Mycobacterium sp. TaxID=1785 RepID=UPI001EBA40E2|nr:hypothetical protein [Mycobacterium sp.]MBW0016601.1 hypothetical protein [Mycobacterium sp.]